MVPGAVPMARQTTGHLARKRKAMGLSVRKGHLGAVGLHERPVKDRLAAVVEDLVAGKAGKTVGGTRAWLQALRNGAGA